MVTQDTIRRRVNRGIALLNTKKPGWFRNINLTRLNIESSFDCIVGQLHKNYGVGMSRLGLDKLYTSNKDVLFGLYAGTGADDTYIDKLNKTWKRAIKQLQSQKLEPVGTHTITITNKELQAEYTDIQGCPLYLALNRCFKMPSGFSITSFGYVKNNGRQIGKARDFNSMVVRTAKEKGSELTVTVDFF